jgi:hypothetical protein
MTRRRRLLLIASLPLAVAVIVVVLAVLSTDSKITKANFDRIKLGMKKTDVSRIFNGATCKWEYPYSNLDLDVAVYVSKNGSIARVHFAPWGVTSKRWIKTSDTLWKKLRRCLLLD